MKIAALLSAFLLASAPFSSLAQEHMSAPTDAPTHSEGTKPDNRGSTGWGGGAKEPDKTGSISPSTNKSDAADQPPLASGVDLKGPPQQFPPTKTPE
ncbi:hypothetical protein [Terrarubrum flagellatum]|uniref:hypothetical protein n=1 Tax=Terrirubrum flagellatum TaxID=2895980 RepID=UPI003145467E